MAGGKDSTPVPFSGTIGPMRYILTTQLAVLCLVISGVGVLSAPAAHFYEARVTIADTRSHQYQDSGDQEKHIANLQKMAMSPVFQERAMKTLALLQIPHPERILESAVVEPVEGTEMLSLKVRGETRTIAKAAGNVIALEFTRYYDEYLQEQGPSGKPFSSALKIISQDTAGIAPPTLIFGRYPKSIAIPVGAGMGGLLIGGLIGILIGKRSMRQREY